MTLAMLFCLSANLFTFAADESVKNSKQISANEAVSKQSSTSNIINAAAIATISACGVVSSAVAGSYYYEKGYQNGLDNNWLSKKNIKTLVGTMLTYKAISSIGIILSTAISGLGTTLQGAIDNQGNTITTTISGLGTILKDTLGTQKNAITALQGNIKAQGSTIKHTIINQEAIRAQRAVIQAQRAALRNQNEEDALWNQEDFGISITGLFN